MPDRRGEQLGNYRLVRLLGEGGFAQVYLGEHTFLKKQAAIKVLHGQVTEDALATFLGEAQTIARLEHPHIVRILDFGVENKVPFLVMSYAPNGTLRQRHCEGSRLPLSTMVSYLKQIAPALQYAYSHKVIHRDIKPQNMLIGLHDELLLSDFGIAVVFESTSFQSTQNQAGTSAYMAPEQYQGKPRPASDQYALGVVVYEWLCGERPFQGTQREIEMQHLAAAPPPLRQKAPHVSVALEHVVLKALAKGPKERFACVQDFAHGFEQACQSPPLRKDPLISNNQERVGQALEKLNRGLRPFVERQMERTYGTSWQEEVRKSLPERHRARRGLHLDTQALLFILRDQWDSVFIEVLGPEERKIIGELLAARNKWAHQEAFSDIDVERILKNIEHLLTWSGPKDSFSRPTFNQASTTRPNATSVNQTPPAWPNLPRSPLPATRADKSPRRAFLIGVASIAAIVTVGSCVLLEQSPRYPNVTSPDQTVTTQETTATSQSQPPFTYKGHAKEVEAVAWSPDGKRIASGSADTTVQVWDASDGSHVFTYHGHSSTVTSVAWSPDGKRIASGSGDLLSSTDTTVQVWDASDGSHIFTYHGHSQTVTSVAWSPDGKRIASGSGDPFSSTDTTVQVWDASDGSHAFTYHGHSSTVTSVAWSPDGQRIASGSDDNTVQVWNASDGSHAFAYRGHSGSVNAVAWSPDGKRIASGSSDGTVQVWNASDGSHVFTYTGDPLYGVDTVAWSPDSKRIASGSSDGTVQVWNASDGSNAFTYTGHSSTVTSVAWSPDGQRIASGSDDNTVQVWQAV